jgi:hypothetical protein
MDHRGHSICGKVRHSYKDFEVSVRYLLPTDDVEDSWVKKLNHQLNCTRAINERIGGNKRVFDNVDYMNPRQEFKHGYITFVPVETSFIWVQCKFFFGKRQTKMNSQRIFHVPAKAERELPGEH